MYYVYGYFNPLKISLLSDIGFEPFYIGKGKNNRAIFHMFESHLIKDTNKHKVNIIRKIKSANLEPIIKILSTFENEDQAFTEEKRLIAVYGRSDLGLGPLSNLTDGGEGSSNKIFSNEYRKKLSEGTKRAIKEGKLNSNLEAFKNSAKGKKQSAEHITNRNESRKGFLYSKESKAKMSVSQQLIRQTPEWKEKASNAQKGKIHSLEHIEKSIINNPRVHPIEYLGIKYRSLNYAVTITKTNIHKIKKDPSFKML